MFKKYLPLFAFLLFLFDLIFPKISLAAAVVSITDYPLIITEGQEFNVSATISGATDGVNYLRADIYKEGTTNYFGETFNGLSWYGGSTGSSYLPTQIVGGIGNGSLQCRMGSPSASEYSGPGNYKLKIRRYYGASGSSYTFSNPVDIQIISSSPTPTESAIPSPTPTSSPTAMPTQTVIPTPMSTPVVTATPIETALPTATATAIATATTAPTILPTETPVPTMTQKPVPTSTPTQTPKPHKDDDRDNHEWRLPFGFKCKVEKHDFEFKKFHFKYYRFHFGRR